MGMTQRQAVGDQTVSLLTCAVTLRIKALIKGGANPNFRTPDGWSAMAEAARSPDDTMLPLLLDLGGDKDIKATANRPLTFVAYLADHWPRTQMLLNRGANINAIDAKEDTLLMVTANLNDYVHMLQLLDWGADPTITSGANKVSVAWTVQDSGGRLTPEREKIRQQVIQELEAKGIHFPVPRPATYRWDPITRTFSLPSR